MLRKPIALLFAVALVLTLAACGDDSGSSSAATQAPAASSAGDTSASGGASASGGSSAGTTAVPNFSGSGSSAFCGQAKELQGVFGGQSFTNTDPSSLKQDYENAQKALKELESKAPDEIKADVKTLSDALGTLMDVFASVNYDVTKLASDPQAAAKLQSFDTQQLQDASTRVEAYLSQVCKIDTTATTGG